MISRRVDGITKNKSETYRYAKRQLIGEINFVMITRSLKVIINYLLDEYHEVTEREITIIRNITFHRDHFTEITFIPVNYARDSRRHRASLRFRVHIFRTFKCRLKSEITIQRWRRRRSSSFMRRLKPLRRIPRFHRATASQTAGR